MSQEIHAAISDEYLSLAQPASVPVFTTDTLTVEFHKTVRAEFLDGESKALRTRVFSGNDAYCIQLLRFAFEPKCWKQLD